MSEPALSFGPFAEAYEAHRPDYPQGLWDVVLGAAKGRACAVDLGSGTGKCLPPLLEAFGRVIAIEPDPRMAALIPAYAKLDLQRRRAEEAVLPHGVDLFTCGTAFHWFEADSVLTRLRAAAAPGAVLAVFTYYRPDPGPAAKRVIEIEIDQRWRPFMSDKRRRQDAPDRVIPGHPGWEVEDRLKIPHRFEMRAEELSAFHATTSYGRAFLESLSDPADYLEDLAGRLAEAAGTDSFEVSLPVETVIARASGGERGDG